MLILVDGKERRPAWLTALPPETPVGELTARLALELKSEGRWLAECECSPSRAKEVRQVATVRGKTTDLAAEAAEVRTPLGELLRLMAPLHQEAAEELRGIETGDGAAFRELVESWQTVNDCLESLAALGEPHPPAEPIEAGINSLTEAAYGGDREAAALCVERLGRIAEQMEAAFPTAK